MDIPLRRNRRFLSLFAAETISGFGDRVHILAIFILVFERTGKALDLGLLAIVQVLPATIMAPLAGWVLDRVDRRRMLIYMDLFQCGLVLLLPITTGLAQILLIAALLSLARQFSEPARMAILPSIVSSEQITRANAVTMSTAHLLMIIGPAVGGLLVARFGLAAAFQLDAASYILSATILLALGACKPPARERIAGGGEAIQQFVREVREGLNVLWGDSVLRFAIAFFALITLVSSMQQPIVIVFVKETLGAGDAGLGMLLSMAGLGGIIGSGLAVVTRRWMSATRLIPLVTAADGLALAGFGLATSLPPAMLLFGVFGLLSGLLEVRVISLFQIRVPEHARGRAFGWLSPIFGPLSVASIAVGTLLADFWGVVPVILGSGIVQTVLGVVTLIWIGSQRELLAQEGG